MSGNKDLETIKQALSAIEDRMSGVEKLVDRRIAELSTEIHATTELISMSEDSIKAHFGEALSVLRDISFSGDGATPHNTGVELGAVINITEDAASQILQAAELVEEIAGDNDPDMWEDEVKRNASLNDLKAAAQNIILACSFQDLTGQRIRRTLDNIETIEKRLSEALERLGIEVSDLKQGQDETEKQNNKAASQADIDALFG